MTKKWTVSSHQDKVEIILNVVFLKLTFFCMNYLLVVVQHCVDKATEILFQVELRKIIFEKYEQTNLLQKK